MIVGRNDTWLTVKEFAAMIDHEPHTVQNWASQGRIQFADLCGVKLVALSTIESMISGHVPAAPGSGNAALRVIGRRDRRGRRTEPERHRPRRNAASVSSNDRAPEVGSPRP